MDKRVFRTNLGKLFQKQGDFVHVDKEQLEKQFNTSSEYDLLTVDEANQLFNQVSEQFDVPTLRTATGYMPLADNVYDYLKDAYADKFETQLEKIDGGFAFGSAYAIEAILDDLDNKVRKDSKKLVPASASYNELRFVRATDTIKQKLDTFATNRVLYTSSWSVRRSVNEDTLQRLLDTLTTTGLDLKEEIFNEIRDSNLANQARYDEAHGVGLGSAVSDVQDESMVL